MNSYDRLYKVLIKEAHSERTIKRALAKRATDLSIANTVSVAHPKGVASQHPHNLAKLVQGGMQMRRVASYLQALKTHGHSAALKAFRGAKKDDLKYTAGTERKYGSSFPKRRGPVGKEVRQATRDMDTENRMAARGK